MRWGLVGGPGVGVVARAFFGDERRGKDGGWDVRTWFEGGVGRG